MGTDESKILEPYQGKGPPPPAGGTGPRCNICGQSTWIEIGGGPIAADVYHPNLDIRPGSNVDIVCDFEKEKLPFHDGHAERIKMIHVINHLTAVSAEKLLRECFKALRPMGSIYIMVTDIEFACRRILEDGPLDPWTTCLWGTKGNTYDADFHKWGYTKKSLSDLLVKTGFSCVEDKGPYNAWEFKMEAWKP